MSSTLTAPTPRVADSGSLGPTLPRLIRSELLKIRTTNTWWIFLIGTVVFTAIPLAIYVLLGNNSIDEAVSGGGTPPTPDPNAPAGANEIAQQQWELSRDLPRVLISTAGNIYTSGQFFGLLFALLLGTLLMTNEYFHQTATTTFLATPHRTLVITAKLCTAVLAAAFFWVVTTVMDLITGMTFFAIKGYASQLTEWPVVRAILLNGLAFGLWGILGVGLGVLIRSQIGAVLTGSLSYVIGTYLISTIATVIYVLTNKAWVLQAQVAWPGVASQVMISPEPVLPDSPEWWVGALVLAGYGVLFGVIGTLLTRKRDIS